MQLERSTPPKPPIAIENQEWEQVASILQTHWAGRKVWAFGSRATGQRLRRFSDLDLALDCSGLPLRQIAQLSEAFEESRLPFKVDLIDLAAITPEFRARIEPTLVLIHS